MQVGVAESKRVIEQQVGVPVTAFAYPVGCREDFTEKTIEIMRDAGFLRAVCTIAESNEVRRQDAFELRYGIPWDQDPAAFALRLNLMVRW